MMFDDSISMTKNYSGTVEYRDYGRYAIHVSNCPDFVKTKELRVVDTQLNVSHVRMLDDFDLEAHSMEFYIDDAISALQGKDPIIMTATAVKKRQGLTYDKLMQVKKAFDQEYPSSDIADAFAAAMAGNMAKLFDEAVLKAATQTPSRLRPGVIPTQATVPDVEPELLADCGQEGDEFMGEVTRVLTPEFRASFPKLFKAEAFQEGQDPKYSMVMLFPKKMNPEMQKRFDAMKAMASAAAKAKWGDKIPKNLRSPFRDGSEKDLPGYEDCIFVSASSKIKPGLVNEEAEPILSPEDFYPGCYAHAYVTCYAYDMAGNRGVAFGLSTVQKTRDGEAFAPRNNAQDDFAPVTPGSDIGTATAPEDVFKV